jgi:hypothetical protein
MSMETDVCSPDLYQVASSDILNISVESPNSIPIESVDWLMGARKQKTEL